MTLWNRLEDIVRQVIANAVRDGRVRQKPGS